MRDQSQFARSCCLYKGWPNQHCKAPALSPVIEIVCMFVSVMCVRFHCIFQLLTMFLLIMLTAIDITIVIIIRASFEVTKCQPETKKNRTFCQNAFEHLARRPKKHVRFCGCRFGRLLNTMVRLQEQCNSQQTVYVSNYTVQKDPERFLKGF